jgi:DNA-binding NarL/FixJ family response regulator
MRHKGWDTSRLDAVQNLRGIRLRRKFVVLTMHVDVSLAVLVFRAGASAFVLENPLQFVATGGLPSSPRQFVARCIGSR